MSKLRMRVWHAMWRGWANRCPNCSEGRIWNRQGGINDCCSACQLAFETDKADWGGFSWAFAVEVLLVAVGAAVVELFFDWSFVTHTYVWSAFVILFHLAFYKNLKGQWIGLRAAMATERPQNRA